MGYLIQAGKGQLALSNGARPMAEVLKDERTPVRLRDLLTQIPGIKKYGEEQGLRPTKNYTSYVQLDRPAASWVVSACPTLAFKPRQWSFPMVGSFTYVGWFDLERAKKYADEIRAEGGWDVDVRGARAFSTLGWFNDPVVSSMISDGPEALGDLVDVVLHESVHATFYINGQSYFNESLAEFVAAQLTPDYMKRLEPTHPGSLEAYIKSEQGGEKRAHEFRQAYQRLADLYVSNVADASKLEEKAKILTDLKSKVGARREINNATLVQFRTYGVGRAEFEELFQTCGRDWKRFWKRVMVLTGASFATQHEEDLGKVLLPLAHSGC